MLKIVYPICCGMDVHKTSVFPQTAGFSRSKMGREPVFIWFSGGRPYLNDMLLRMMSGIVPGTQSIFRRPMERARLSSSCATYSIQS